MPPDPSGTCSGRWGAVSATATGGANALPDTLHRSAAILKAKGFDFFTGVPCSILAGLIEELSSDPAGYVPAVREDLALGLASGAYLGGRWPVVLMQNSGLGYCLNVLTSLNLIDRIPLLMLIGYRGDTASDAPEHRMMGQHCQALLEEVGIPVWVPKAGELSEAISEADASMKAKRIPAAVLIRSGVL